MSHGLTETEVWALTMGACEAGILAKLRGEIWDSTYSKDDTVRHQRQYLKATIKKATEGARIDWSVIMGVKQKENESVQDYGVRKWEAYPDY